MKRCYAVAGKNLSHLPHGNTLVFVVPMIENYGRSLSAPAMFFYVVLYKPTAYVEQTP
jgi:hypothetical protein